MHVHKVQLGACLHGGTVSMLMASFVRLHTADDCRMGLPEVPRHADTGAGH